MSSRRRTPYGQRPSASGDAARRAEFARLAAMSPWERMLLSLRLGYRGKMMGRAKKAEEARRDDER